MAFKLCALTTFALLINSEQYVMGKEVKTTTADTVETKEEIAADVKSATKKEEVKTEENADLDFSDDEGEISDESDSELDTDEEAA